MVVAFTQADLELIERIGAGRQASKEKRRIADRKQVRIAGEDIHKLGFAASLALARALGVEPDTKVSTRGNKGVSLRVEQTTFNTHYNPTYQELRYWVERVPEVDILVLVVGSLPRLVLAGWVERQGFLYGKRTEILPGKGERWLMSRHQLKPMAELIERFRVRQPGEVEQPALFPLGV